MQRIWAKRQGQIERVTNTMATVAGDINAIAHDAIPGLNEIDPLALPDSNDSGLCCIIPKVHPDHEPDQSLDTHCGAIITTSNAAPKGSSVPGWRIGRRRHE